MSVCVLYSAMLYIRRKQLDCANPCHCKHQARVLGSDVVFGSSLFGPFESRISRDYYFGQEDDLKQASGNWFPFSKISESFSGG